MAAVVGIFVALAAGIAVVEARRERPAVEALAASRPTRPIPTITTTPATTAPTTTAPTTTTAPPPPDLPTADGRVAVRSFDERFRWTLIGPPLSQREPLEMGDGGAPVIADVWVAQDEDGMEVAAVYALGNRSDDLEGGPRGFVGVYRGTVSELSPTTILDAPALMGRFDIHAAGMELNGYGVTVQLGDTAVLLASLGTGDPLEQMASYLLLVDSFEEA